MSRRKVFFIAIFAIFGLAIPARANLDLDKLPEKDILVVKTVLRKLDPVIKEKDSRHALATLTFEELYAPLNKKEARFLKEFQDLDARALNVKIPYRGIATGKEPLVKITGQKVRYVNVKDGATHELSVQYLPEPVYKKYQQMMAAMQKDIGKRLLIESGYRSSAYQLYLFVYYLKNHAYSIRETVKWVALPGYSEHGAPAHQAIDFINQEGINGDPNTKEFEDLPENLWLLKHAGEFGFVLSYPKSAPAGITYEPWHWRYDRKEKNGR